MGDAIALNKVTVEAVPKATPTPITITTKKLSPTFTPANAGTPPVAAKPATLRYDDRGHWR